MRRGRSFATLCFISLFFPLLGATSAPAESHLTCAILSDVPANKSAAGVVGAAEANLLDQADLAWVERTKVDAILREQELQAMLAPEEIASREKIGGLLKADVLIAIHLQEQPVPALHLTVCETKQGLRLVSDSILLTSNQTADAGALQASILRGLAKTRQPILQIIAVPPFVDDSLTRAAEALKTGYAKLIETELGARPGFVAVELAEANAISDELTLTNTVGISRPLPIYLLGNFRRTATGTDISLHLKRGDEVGAPSHAEHLTQPDATAFVRRSSADLVDAMLHLNRAAPSTQPDSSIEAAELAGREKVFLKLGDWSEAAALCEASLLLNPQQPDLHGDAFRALDSQAVAATPVIRDEYQGEIPDTLVEAFALARSSLPHLEAYLEGTEITTWEVKQPPGWFIAGIIARQRQPGRRETPTHKAVDQFAAEAGNVVTRVLQAKAASRVQDDTLWLVEPYLALPVPSHEMSSSERTQAFEARRSLINQFAFLATGPHAEETAAKMIDTIGTHRSTLPLDSPERMAFFASLESSANPAIVAVATKDLHNAQQLAHWRSTTHPTVASNLPVSDPQNAVDVRATFEPLTFGTPTTQPSTTAPKLTGWITAGDRDFVCDEAGLSLVHGNLLVRLTDDLRLPGNATSQTPRVCFDGRYIWAIGKRSSGDSMLIALDPANGSIVENFGPGDGVPPQNFDAAVAPISPGKVAVAGWFDDHDKAGEIGRTWVGVASVDANSFRTIFEAKRVHEKDDRDEWRMTDVGLPISFLTVLTKPSDAQGPTSSRIVLGRLSINDTKNGFHPLLIDPETGVAEVAAGSIHAEYLFAPTPDSICWASPDVNGNRPIYRSALPDLHPQLISESAPTGPIAFADGRAFVMSRTTHQLFVADTLAGPWMALSDLPAMKSRIWAREIEFSRQFGLILLDQKQAYLVHLPPTLPTVAPTTAP